MKLNMFFILMFSVLILSLVGCNQESGTNETESASDSDIDNSNTDEPVDSSTSNTDGELKIGIISQPSTLDAPMTTEAVVRDISMNIYETLITLDSENNPVPMLAESVEVSEDGKTYTFRLRENVKFHNGKIMTSDDVLASMNRWLERSGVAQQNFSNATFEAIDEQTIILNVEQPRLDILNLLAGQGQFPAIMPKEIVEAADSEGVSEYIGTGPFKFEEWKQDQYIHLTKFDEYVALDSPADGLAGKKEALVKDIFFYFTKDSSTLLTGVQTGEFDIAFSVAFDNYEQVKNDPSLNVYSAYFGTMNLVYNKKEGLFTDIKMRQAINAGLNATDAMLGAFADEDLYRMGSSYMNEDVKNWYSEAGKEAYDQANIEKAKQLLDEAGYSGEEITILTSRDIEYHYSIAVIVQEQLKQMGINSNIEVYDWATHVEKRGEPSNWDLLTAGFNYETTPTQIPPLRPDWPGWAEDEKVTELMDAISSATSIEEGKELWGELQEYAWTEYVPYTQFGAVPVLIAAKDYVEGLSIMDRPIMMPLWNTRINQ